MSAMKVLTLLIALCLFCLAMVVGLKLAHAHDWFTGTRDPVTNGGCCGGNDCALLKVEKGVLEAEPAGYRLRLTAEQAKAINPSRKEPVDTVVPWDRIQPSPDGNFYLCIPYARFETLRADFYCFWAPPNT